MARLARSLPGQIVVLKGTFEPPERRGQVSWAELEVPNSPSRAQVSWAEFEVPNAPRRAQVSWSEFEVPTAPRRSQVSWSEFEIPDAPGGGATPHATRYKISMHG